jgi:uncharacterized membrane-anchored protein
MNNASFTTAHPADNPATMLNKVPAVTLAFWLIKIMATTVGETAADFLNSHFNLGLGGTSVIVGVLLAATLVWQFKLRRYVPAAYWAAVVLLSVFGTLITDNLVDNLGVSLQTTTAVFSVALAASFAAWVAVERSLSIHTITTSRREGFYWAAILFTFALGTAAGDLMAEGLQLGYAPSALIYGGLIGAVALAHLVFKANAVASFWVAYVLTRPFGASCGDWLSQPVDNGGLGLGTVYTSAVFLAVIPALMGWMSWVQRQADRPAF